MIENYLNSEIKKSVCKPKKNSDTTKEESSLKTKDLPPKKDIYKNALENASNTAQEIILKGKIKI